MSPNDVLEGELGLSFLPGLVQPPATTQRFCARYSLVFRAKVLVIGESWAGLVDMGLNPIYGDAFFQWPGLPG